MNKYTLFFLSFIIYFIPFKTAQAALDPDGGGGDGDFLAKSYGFGNIGSLGELVSTVLPVILNLAGVAVLFYLLFGIFKLIASGGEKNAVASSREMITHAIIGLVLLILIFVFVRFLPEAIGLTNYNILP